MIPVTWPPLLSLSAVLLAATAAAQAPAAKPVPTGSPQVKQLAAWPTLSKTEVEKGLHWIKLVSRDKLETREKAAATLRELGPGMVERLFLRMSDSPHRKDNEALAEILTGILLPEHAQLIAPQAKHKSVFARRFTLKLLANFAQRVSAPVFQRARKDKDVEVAYYASLGLVRTTDDTTALDAILARCVEEWDVIGNEVARFLSPARDARFEPWLAKKLGSKVVAEQIATLRMMRSLSPESGKRLVKPFLDSSESILKKESINTLRVIVDGQEPMPLKKITVFLIIKMAKEWKARI